MEYQTLELNIKNNLAIVVLSRPEVFNSMDALMRAELTAVVKYAENNSRCIVITGSKKIFCSGQDLGSDSKLSNLNLERTLREEYEPLLRAIYNCKVPTVAAVNGSAAGAGASLAFRTDIVIATESSFFSQTLNQVGLIADSGFSYFVPKNIGLVRALGASFFGDKISAREAQDIGMIWKCVRDKDFEEFWRGKAHYLAMGPTQAFIRTRATLRESFKNSFEEQIKLEAKLQGECGQTHDFKEGVLAFLENRNAGFEGR